MKEGKGLSIALLSTRCQEKFQKVTLHLSNGQLFTSMKRRLSDRFNDWLQSGNARTLRSALMSVKEAILSLNL